MANVEQSITLVSLSTATLAVGIALMGMSSPGHRDEPGVTLAATGLPKNLLLAADTLKTELNRRFTDRQNVDFGMSRVIRAGSRLHFGPTMDKTIISTAKVESRKNDKGEVEFFVDGVWVGAADRKPMMSPENDAESRAIKTLKDSGASVAIYTVGQFELDKGEPAFASKAVQSANPHYVYFTYGDYGTLRAKGPAYISQAAPNAPRAYEVIDIARDAWASGKTDFVANRKDGWAFFVHKVSAPDMSCAKCHGDRTMFVDKTQKKVVGAVHQAGDPVGVFVIALKMSN